MAKAIQDLKSTKLFQYLAACDPDLSKNCLQFVEFVEPLLLNIREYFPYYTRHDATHSYQVVNRIEQVVFGECLVSGNSKSFTAIDVFLLITAAYGHDLGMTVLPGESDGLQDKFGLTGNPKWQTDKELQKYLRRTHSERGGNYISSNYQKAGIPIYLIQPLNLLNQSHNDSLTSLHQKVGTRWSFEGKEYNLLQLACILCTADLLEYSQSRVLDGVIDQLEHEISLSTDPYLVESLRENLKHAFINSNLAIGSDGKIIMNGSFTDPDVLSLTYKTVEYIQKWVRDYCDIDLMAEEKRMRLRSDSVLTNFEIPGKEFERLGVRMNKQNVISLIASNSVWNNKPELVVKELLQNAVEACRYRKFHSPASDLYKPSITVILDKVNKTIKIEDNGCGMSRSVILNNFLTVGNSRTKEPDYIQTGYASLARFGIGFWSVFTIAERATIKTIEYRPGEKNDMNSEGLGFEVSINLLKDYIVFEKKEDFPGTVITLYLKDNVSLSQIINNLTGPYGVMYCSEIPIEINYWGNTIKFSEEPVIPTLEDLFGPKIGITEKENIELFTSKISKDGVSLNSFIVHRKSQNSVSFLFSNEDPINLAPFNHYDVKCVCGFVIKGQDQFPIHEIVNTSAVGFISNTSDPSGIEYSINRQSVLSNTAAQGYFTKVDLLLMESYRDFLKSVCCYNTKDIFRLYVEGKHSGYSGGLFDTTNKLEQLYEHASDLYCFKLFRLNPDGQYKDATIEYYTIRELLSQDYILVTGYHFFSIHGGHRKFFDFQNEHYYEFCRSMVVEEKQAYYFRRGESDTIFSNDPESYVIFFPVQNMGNTSYITLLVSHSQTVHLNAAKEWVIGMVHGKWTGLIAEKKIIGSNFAFVQQKCFLQPGSTLAKHVRRLFNESMFPEICELMTKLELALFGFPDPSIKEFIV
jgi:hypothetical protein